MADKDLLKTAQERYKRCVDLEAENRRRALEALKFRNLEQWDQQVKNTRETDPEGARPCLVLDKTNQAVRQVVNDIRQNRPSIKVRPADDYADKRTAEIYQGIIRHIEACSNADIAYDTGAEQAVDGGFGYWRIVTEYCDEMSFDQDIRIKRVRNRFSVYLGEHQEPDGSDAKYGFVAEKMSLEDFKAQYPDAKKTDFSASVDGTWVVSDDQLIVAEYFYIEYESAEIALLPDGQVVRKSEVPQGITPVKTRKTRLPRVKWAKITQLEVLETRDWPGKTIPIPEVVGNELDIEGKRYLSGMITAAMDAQRMYNYAGSSFVESVGLAPRAPWVIAEGQIEGHENDWKTANRRNLSALIYKPVLMEGANGPIAVPAPQRQSPPGIPSGWQAVMANSEHDIQGAMGLYRESLGESSNAKSGRAILARQKEGDTGSFHYADNQLRAVRYTGQCLVDLIPKIYDTKRIARILGEDGKEEYAQIDPELQDETGRKIAYKEREREDGSIEKIYNLSVGRYDVIVSAGPSYTTKRQEGAEFLMNVSQSSPQLMPIIGDLMFKSLDMPYADEVAERLEKMLPPQLQEKDDGGEEDLTVKAQQIEQLGQALAAKEQQLTAIAQEMTVKEDELKALEQSVGADKAQVQAERHALQADRKVLLADYGRIKAEIENMQLSARLAAVQSLNPQGPL